jgi:hypothetical protein
LQFLATKVTGKNGCTFRALFASYRFTCAAEW